MLSRSKFSFGGLAFVALFGLAACGKSTPDGGGASSADKGAASGSADAPAWFVDMGPVCGIDIVHKSGHRPKRFLFPEMSGGGVVLFDYDGDGRLDVYCVQSGYLAEEDLALVAAGTLKPEPSRLYRNLGGFKFEDVTAKAGVGGNGGYGMGATAGDYDGDGDTDLFVTTTADDILYRNNGDGTFTDVTKESGASNGYWSTGASFADLDNDGDLDLFVANYINWARHREIDCMGGDNTPDYCGPNNYKAPCIDSIFRNEGGGRFKEVTREAGLEAAYGNGFGVAIADFNRDGKLDVYVANDGNENQLWINRGGLKFDNRALIAGCALGPEGVAQAGMGIAFPDINEDGFYDIFVTNLRNETNAMYVYDGKEHFHDRIVAVGLGAASFPMTGFGCGFSDFDNDGRLDLYVANGAVMRPRGIPLDPAQPYGEINQVFRGVDGPRFEEIKPRGGTTVPLVHASRPAAFGDLDDDGAVDVVVMNWDGPTYVLRNVAPKRGGWVGFLVTSGAGGVAIGADVVVSYGAKKRHAMVMPGSSFNSCNDPRVHVGLGDAKEASEVRILWPDGSREVFGPYAAGAYYELQKGKGRAP